MRNLLTTAVLITVVGVLVGMGLGGFITYRSVQAYLDSVPGAPVVVGAEYSKEKNALILTVFNPGGLPITVVGGSLVFKPKNGEGYSLTNLPVEAVIPPQKAVSLVINLQERTAAEGDLIEGGFTYRYPYIGQLYYTSYPLTVGKPYHQNPGEILKKAKEEAESEKSGGERK